MTNLPRIASRVVVQHFAQRFGCRVYFDYNIERGSIGTFVIRPDGAKRLFVFKRWSQRRIKEVTDFMMPT
jgi:hypothetical protein